MSKIKNKDLLSFTYGVVIFEFFGNTDENFKIRSLVNVSKELRKQFNVTVCRFEDNLVENPERGALALGFVSSGNDKAGEQRNKVLQFLEANVPARISLDDFETLALDY